MIITKKFSPFDAAHQLPNHDGKCANIHGHTYHVEADVEGPVFDFQGTSDQGMTLDFGILNTMYKERIDAKVDHSLLLGTVPLRWYEWITQKYMEETGLIFLSEEAEQALMLEIGLVKTKKVAKLPISTTTAENLARWIFNELDAGLTEYCKTNHIGGVSIVAVRVAETPTSIAECRRGR